MIRALLFDLGNVIVGLDFDRAYRAAAELGPYSPDEIRQRLGDGAVAEPYECGRMSSEQFHQRCLELLGIELDFESFAELWGDMFETEPLLDDALVAGLAERYLTVIVSNTNELHMRYIRREYPIMRLFERFVLSYEVGAMKPDRRFYEAALETANVAADECVFIDDKPENVAGAEAMGIPSIRFRNQAQLAAALEGLGVTVY